MARKKRDNDYVDLIEHVLGGVQVTISGEPRTGASRLEITRGSWARGTTSSEEEVVVPIDSIPRKSRNCAA